MLSIDEIKNKDKDKDNNDLGSPDVTNNHLYRAENNLGVHTMFGDNNNKRESRTNRFSTDKFNQSFKNHK